MCHQQVPLKFTVNLRVRPSFISKTPQQGFSKRLVPGRAPLYASTFRKYATVALNLLSSEFSQLKLFCYSCAFPVEGHDSSEDASACLELMIWKIKEDTKVKRWPLTPRLHFPQVNFLPQPKFRKRAPALTELRSECRGESWGQTDAFSTRSLSLSLLLPVEPNERTASPFKAIGAQINSVFICLSIFLFCLMLIQMYFCLFHQSPLKASRNFLMKPFSIEVRACVAGALSANDDSYDINARLYHQPILH